MTQQGNTQNTQNTHNLQQSTVKTISQRISAFLVAAKEGSFFSADVRHKIEQGQALTINEISDPFNLTGDFVGFSIQAQGGESVTVQEAIVICKKVFLTELDKLSTRRVPLITIDGKPEDRTAWTEMIGDRITGYRVFTDHLRGVVLAMQDEKGKGFCPGFNKNLQEDSVISFNVCMSYILSKIDPSCCSVRANPKQEAEILEKTVSKKMIDIWFHSNFFLSDDLRVSSLTVEELKEAKDARYKKKGAILVSLSRKLSDDDRKNLALAMKHIWDWRTKVSALCNDVGSEALGSVSFQTITLYKK